MSHPLPCTPCDHRRASPIRLSFVPQNVLEPYAERRSGLWWPAASLVVCKAMYWAIKNTLQSSSLILLHRSIYNE